MTFKLRANFCWGWENQLICIFLIYLWFLFSILRNGILYYWILDNDNKKKYWNLFPRYAHIIVAISCYIKTQEKIPKKFLCLWIIWNRCLKVVGICLAFHIMTLRKYSTRNFEIFFKGYLHFGPSKCGVSMNDHPSTVDDPSTLKMWIFAKN